MFVKPKINCIKDIRAVKGLSQHQVSLRAGLSGCALSRIESGKTKMIHELRAREIARALNCKIEDIFTEPEIS